jgi:hypothetical protein
MVVSEVVTEVVYMAVSWAVFGIVYETVIKIDSWTMYGTAVHIAGCASGRGLG